MVKGGDAVGGDQQLRFANRIEIAHLAACKQREIREIGLRECLQGFGCLRVKLTSILRRGQGFVNARRRWLYE
jgi:hypothetical protein